MTITRRESRSRVAVLWFDDEQEADAYTARMFATEHPDSIEAANLGFIQVGRDPALDTRDADGTTTEFAVVTP